MWTRQRSGSSDPKATGSLCPTGYVGSKSPRGPAALSLLLDISQPLCLPTDPNITSWCTRRGCSFGWGCPGEGSHLPVSRSSAAQRISCYFWGPLGECRPSTCLTKPQSVALFTERQRQVLLCRAETANMVFSQLPSVPMGNVPASDMVGCAVRRKEVVFPV